jgi:hypothetical protein
MSRKNGAMSVVLAESRVRIFVLGIRQRQPVFIRLKLRSSFESSLQKSNRGRQTVNLEGN